MQSSQLSALSIGAQPQLLRLTAHKIADDIYQKLTGIPGIFSTRISYAISYLSSLLDCARG